MTDPTGLERRTVMIRNLDTELWVALRTEAIRRRWDVAPMLEMILREWLARQKAGQPEATAKHD